jgi:alkylation response protein AidB-like acyl-CoA dehydrogenase
MAALRGGSFLLEEGEAAAVFTPEDFSEEHRAIARTAAQFFAGEVAPNIEAIQHQEPGAAVAVLRKAAALGLTSVAIPRSTAVWNWTSSQPWWWPNNSRVMVVRGWHGRTAGSGRSPGLLRNSRAEGEVPAEVGHGGDGGCYALTEPQAGRTPWRRAPVRT